MNVYTSKTMFIKAQGIVAKMNEKIHDASEIKVFKSQLKALGARTYWDSYCNEWILSTRLA